LVSGWFGLDRDLEIDEREKLRWKRGWDEEHTCVFDTALHTGIPGAKILLKVPSAAFSHVLIYTMTAEADQGCLLGESAVLADAAFDVSWIVGASASDGEAYEALA
jgi:hypothetical protein